MAGMIDADGCINLYPNRKHYQVYVDICQASKANLVKLQDIWGGRVAKHPRSYHLIWSSKKEVHRILETVLFHLKFKLDQAGVVLLYISDATRRKGHPYNKVMADALYKQVKLCREEYYAR